MNDQGWSEQEGVILENTAFMDPFQLGFQPACRIETEC